MKNRTGWLAASLSLALSTALATALTAAPAAAENIKRGGILTYMIPADAPPSLDGHKENTYATLHATARGLIGRASCRERLCNDV